MGQYTSLQVSLLRYFDLKILAVTFRECALFPFHHTQVGPHAVNLAGGQAASMRIAKDIIRRQNQEELEEKSKTDEYVQQMQGLLWL